jgi:hypothetical protein
MPGNLTRPHDYRALLRACPDLTIVGGQAVNVWAVTYLDPEHSSPSGFGSLDLDVLAHAKASEIKTGRTFRSSPKACLLFCGMRIDKLLRTRTCVMRSQ